MTSPHDLHFKTRTEWRNWLTHNASQATEVWVILYKKHSDQEGLTYRDAVEEAICFGWIDSKMNRVDEHTFRQRFSPRRKNSIWSKSNKNLALQLIDERKMMSAGYDAINEAKRNGNWQEAYTSKTLPLIPDDLQHALHTSPPAERNFQAFPNSTKLMYLYWIQSAKRRETRVKRIQQVVERAINQIKPN